MDEKVIEDFKFHQESVSKDVSSPLHLIREKEMEISGRVLAAKQEAEEIVATARRRATETITKAQDAAESAASDRQAEVVVEVDHEVERLREQTEIDAKELAEAIAGRREKAAALLVEAVKRV